MRVTARPFDGRLNGPFYLRGPRPYIDPLHNYYGAVGNGVADDTLPLQNALDDAENMDNGSPAMDGGVVQLLPGSYRTTATLRIRAPSPDFARGICLLGVGGPSTCKIISEVPGDVALSVEGQKFYRGGGFTLLNGSGSRGTTTGLAMTGDPENGAVGTVTSGGAWDHLFVDGYHWGIKLGVGNYDASEMIFNALVVQNNDTGILGNGFNALDFVFNMLIMAGNEIGLDEGQAGQWLIVGGSASGNGIDFKMENGGSTTIVGFRSETFTDRHISCRSPSVAPHSLTVITPNVSGVLSPDGGAVLVYRGTACTILGGVIQGKIFVDAWTGVPSTRLNLENVSIMDTVPFRPTSAGHLVGLQATVLGCKQLNGATEVIGTFDDLVGATYSGADAQNGGLSIREGGLIGFNGATPIHPTLAAAASDPATTMALANDLRAKLIAMGLTL